MIGKTLDKYEILEEVGQGGMATVFRARDTRLDREVAIKVLHPHLARQEVARLRFHREAHAVARLRHPNILAIYDYSGEDAEVAYIVTELVRGETLREHLDRRGIRFPEVAICIAIKLLEALQHAHEHGVIHRDVKPENVMIREDGSVKLADFGIAHLTDGEGMTLTGTVIGSPAHMSPEQIQGQELSPTSDIFSLGTVLYLMITGELPFRAPNPQALFRKILEAEYLPAQQLNDLTSDQADRAIKQALARRPAQRFSNARAMADELIEDLEELGLGDTTAELNAYFRDPAGYEAWLLPQLLERLVTRGDELLEQGRRVKALSLYNRALCLDPQEPRVLAAVESIGQQDRLRSVRRWGRTVGPVLAAAAMLGAAYYLGFLPYLRSSTEAPMGPGVLAGSGLTDAGTRAGPTAGFLSSSSLRPPASGLGPGRGADATRSETTDRRPPGQRPVTAPPREILPWPSDQRQRPAAGFIRASALPSQAHEARRVLRGSGWLPPGSCPRDGRSP